MREQWHGDHRDVIKWSVLVHLAIQEGLRQVLQVLYLRPSGRPEISFGSGHFKVPEPVWRHFHELQRASELSKSTGIEVVVFDEPFEPRKRLAYTGSVVNRFRAMPRRGTAILLDPDTGIGDSDNSPRHVTPSDVTAIFEALRPDDWLVLYQHALRAAGWRRARRSMFERAAGKKAEWTFQSEDSGRDVAFFAVLRR